MLILLDQDGVLADFEHGIAHGWQTRYGTPVPLPQPRQNFYVRDDAAPEEHLGFDWTARVMLTKDKTLVRGDILIDDKPEISGSLSPVWQHWLYDAPYNRHINTPRRIRWQDPASWATLLTP